MKQAYLASKPRYEILDGLRGVAALLVIGYHLFESYYGGGPDQPINHGYLAVDFFFALSGFVIGYAYDDRWKQNHPRPLPVREGSGYTQGEKSAEKLSAPLPHREGQGGGAAGMALGQFFKRRLIRLHPMIIAGSVTAVLLYYFSDCTAFPLVNTMPWWQLVGMMLLGMLMVPVSPAMDVRGWQEFYPLNGPQWSLLWEYLANILYALVIRHFSKKVLMVFVALSALLTLNLTLNIDVGGILAPRDWAKYTVVGGWSMTADQELIGLTRLLYPFFCGLLISRMGWLTKVKNGFWWTSLMVAVALCIPHLNGTENALEDGIYQTVCILVLFPLIVSMGAGSTVTGRSARLCRWLGQISYPVYITHYAFIYMQMSWAEHHQELPTSTHIFVAVCLFILSILTAQAWLKLYDEPVREWLKRKQFG